MEMRRFLCKTFQRAERECTHTPRHIYIHLYTCIYIYIYTHISDVAHGLEALSDLLSDLWSEVLVCGGLEQRVEVWRVW